MTKAKLVIESIERVYGNSVVFNTQTINSKLQSLLNNYGYSDITVQSNIDVEDGIYVKFAKSDEDVVVVFTTDSGYPQVVVVSSDDANLTIDLRTVNPPTTEAGPVSLIDLTDTSWFSKSMISAILDAGRLTEEDELYVIRGGQTVKLPLMIKSSEKSEFAKRCAEKVKSMIWQ